jgi:hypothetical protein
MFLFEIYQGNKRLGALDDRTVEKQGLKAQNSINWLRQDPMGDFYEDCDKTIRFHNRSELFE